MVAQEVGVQGVEARRGEDGRLAGKARGGSSGRPMEVGRSAGKKEVVALEEEPSTAWTSPALPSGHHAREGVDPGPTRAPAAPMGGWVAVGGT